MLLKSEEILEKNSQKFEELFDLYMAYNSHTNISSIRDRDGVYAKHFLDSLAVLPYVQAGSVLDLGTGGGFPALPLAIVRDDLQITALDSVGKKIKFIEEVKQKMQINNLNAVCARAEDLAHEAQHRERYDLVLSRAVAELRVLAEYAVAFIKPAGHFIAFKKSDNAEEISSAKYALKELALELEQEIQYHPEKKLLIFRKLSGTDSQYPRNTAQIKKQPL